MDGVKVRERDGCRDEREEWREIEGKERRDKIGEGG